MFDGHGGAVRTENRTKNYKLLTTQPWTIMDGIQDEEYSYQDFSVLTPVILTLTSAGVQ